MEVDLLVHSKYIIPVVPHDTVIEDGCIVVKDGKIVDIGHKDQVAHKYKPAQVLELGHQLITAGLVNAHTHAGMTHMRGMAEDLKLAEWLMDEIWPAEAKHVNYDFTFDGTELALAEMVKGGVTTIIDMYFFPEAAAAACEKVGVRAVLAVPLLEFPTNYAKNFDEYFAKAEKHILENKSALVSFAFGPHAPYTVTEEHLVLTWKRANELNVPFHIHLHETMPEVRDSTEGNDSLSRHKSGELLSPVKNFQRLGLISPRLMAVHMTQLDDEEVAFLGKAKVNIVHCPESNMKLASGFCPVQKLIDAGANVCLGTDSAASNNDLSMIGEMKTAALLGKLVAGDARAMKGQTAIRMATINGAIAAGLDKVTGSLEIGKSADFISVDFDLLECQPLFNPAVGLIYASQSSHVTNVWVAGKRILEDQKLTTVNEDDLRKRVVSWNEKLRSK